MNNELIESGKRVVDEIYPAIKQYSAMTYEESCFLAGAIDKYQPKKILEVGVFRGASSAVILNAVKTRTDVKVHSVDVDEGGNVGQAVHRHFMSLAANWKLHKGKIFARVAEEIGGGIDLVLLDTLHVNPVETLDCLQILPCLNPNAVLVLHDIMLHNFLHADDSHSKFIQDAPMTYRPFVVACNGTLFASIQAKNKFIFRRADQPAENPIVPLIGNIGAVELGENPLAGAFSIFYLLALPWFWPVAARCYSRDDFRFLGEYFHKHYPENECEIYDLMLKWITENDVTNVHKKSWRIIPGKTYAVYGAANRGAAMKRECEKLGAKILCFCDSDSTRHGKEFCGVPVISPTELAKRRSEYHKVIVASGNFQDIQAALEELDLVPEKDFVMWFRKYVVADSDSMQDADRYWDGD